MRRLLAQLLLLVLSFPLILPLFASTTEENLPACCRRDGKHACAMRKPVESAEANAAALGLRAQSERCGQYPLLKNLPSDTATGPVVLGRIFQQPAVYALSMAEQLVVLGRISLARAFLKRGPPAQLLA